MTTKLKTFCLLTITTFIYISCSDLHNQDSGQPNAGSLSSELESLTQQEFSNFIENSVSLNNYLVVFNGKSYDESTDRSTFSYTVSGTGVEPALNYLFIETPACAGAPVTYAPSQSAKVSSDGITWEASISTTGSRDYSITYSGDLPIGGVEAKSESGNTEDTATIPGPCKGIHTISGSVFVDADQNQERNLTESGIQNVTVRLSDGNDYLLQKTTDTGSFIFSVFTGNSSANFTVEVLESSQDATDFNETLFDTYLLTLAPPTITVTVNQVDITGTDFGFTPQTQKLIAQFEDGTIFLDTEDPKYWIQQLRYASKGNKNADFTATQFIDFLTIIEDNFQDNSFNFSFGEDKIKAALDILSRPIKTEFESLLVQLLAAELNVVSGGGSDSEDFNRALLAFGEAAAANALENLGTFEVSSLDTVTSIMTQTNVTTSSTSTVSDANQLLTSFNFSGGGGGVGNK